MFTKQALGAFLAGGVLVGGVAFAGVAHGASTNAGSTSTGGSDAQYTAKHAWAQSVPNNNSAMTVSVPTGERVTITGAFHDANGIDACTLSGSVDGASFSFFVQAAPDASSGASSVDAFNPVTLDSGSIACNSGSGASVTLVGYVTTG
jgi:hypothetical protein